MSFLARITGQVVQAYQVRDVHLHQRTDVDAYDDGWPSAEERLKGYVKAADHLVRDRPCLGLPAGVVPRRSSRPCTSAAYGATMSP